MLSRVHAGLFYLCRQLELPPRAAGADPAPLYCQGDPRTVTGSLQRDGSALCCRCGVHPTGSVQIAGEKPIRDCS